MPYTLALSADPAGGGRLQPLAAFMTNPTGATITADVTFTGKMAIKVRYVMLYKKDELVDEIWQIYPKLAD